MLYISRGGRFRRPHTVGGAVLICGNRGLSGGFWGSNLAYKPNSGPPKDWLISQVARKIV